MPRPLNLSTKARISYPASLILIARITTLAASLHTDSRAANKPVQTPQDLDTPDISDR
jgi:hypothetical protein